MVAFSKRTWNFKSIGKNKDGGANILGGGGGGGK